MYIFCALIVVVAVIFGMFGSRRHNKFALLVAMCSLLLTCSVTLLITIAMFVAITPKFSQAVGTQYVRVNLCVRGTWTQRLDDAASLLVVSC